jgi:hypothetical protein
MEVGCGGGGWDDDDDDDDVSPLLMTTQYFGFVFSSFLMRRLGVFM